MFWVNDEVQTILQRSVQRYLVTDYKTPSGKVHVGALRGVLIHDAIYRGLVKAGVQSEYLYGFDDFDPMDGMPVYLDEPVYRQYMGMPLCAIPSPVSGFKSFAEYYAKDFLAVFNTLGVHPTIVWDSDSYTAGEYNESIRIILDNAAAIRQIYKDVSGSVKTNDWHPLQVVCPACGKIGTTKVIGWDGTLVTFSCEPAMVEWAAGCGHTGTISPFDGNAKLPYKLAIVARWYFRGTQVELAGLDHYTKGGTFYVAAEIARRVFKIEPAYGHIYEWLMIDGGKKMSSSTGVGVSAAAVVESLPAELVRFLMMRTRARTRIQFSLEGEAIPRLYDELDRCIDEYLADPQSDRGQAYEYARLTDAAPPVYRLRFSKIAYLLQMPRADITQYAETEKGAPLDSAEQAELQTRADYAKTWLKLYAPENYQFVVQATLPSVSLTAAQQDFLQALLKVFSAQKEWSGEELHVQIHEVKKQSAAEPKELFGALYQIFLGKDAGPQVGWLLASLDHEFVIERLSQATK
ncbi:lysine--tRNA ligase [Candidatus Falkowbacteria bacterium]|nr:lysine--tRNA ligase [Candidatus Falkowbacteria bacterium]